MVKPEDIGVGRRFRHVREAIAQTRGVYLDRARLVPEPDKFQIGYSAPERPSFVVRINVTGNR